MGFFSKRPKSLVPSDILSQLREYGQVCWIAVRSGGAAADGRFDWSWLSGAMMALRTDTTSSIAEIHAAAGSDEMARFGGYRVIAEYDGGLQDPLFLDLMDSSLDLKNRAGLSNAFLTGYERDRWVANHGDVRNFGT